MEKRQGKAQECADLNLLVLAEVNEVPAPSIRRGNNQTPLEWFFAGSGKERVQLRFIKIVVRLIKLALNRPDISRCDFFGDNINAGVRFVPAMWALAPKPYIAAKQSSVVRISAD